MSARSQYDVVLYAFLGRKIVPSPSAISAMGEAMSRKERNREYAKVRCREDDN